MRLLLDTHALLWFAAGSERLSPAARGAIEEPGNELLFSAASVWEMAIKLGLGRLSLDSPLPQFIERQRALIGFELLPVAAPHVYGLLDLPSPHRDPFDRLLAAVCRTERAEIVSADAIFDAYRLTRRW